MAWFACATRRPIAANTGGPLNPNLGCLLHHAVTDADSLFSQFNSPSAGVSAHFYITQAGLIEQYVDTAYVAWHARDLNINYVGVETQGCAQPPYADPMSDAMVNAFARLYAEGMQIHRWPAVLISQKGQSGFGYHRLPGSENGPGGRYPTGCPCDVRMNTRQRILDIATASPEQIGQEDMVLLVQNPNNKGWAILDIATGTYKGLSDASVLDFYQRNGVPTANPQPSASQWSKFKQSGTI